MNNDQSKKIAESLVETFNYAGNESIRLYKEGLKIEIKEEITNYVFKQKKVGDNIVTDLHEIIDERFEKFYDSKQVYFNGSDD